MDEVLRVVRRKDGARRTWRSWRTRRKRQGCERHRPRDAGLVMPASQPIVSVHQRHSLASFSVSSMTSMTSMTSVFHTSCARGDESLASMVDVHGCCEHQRLAEPQFAEFHAPRSRLGVRSRRARTGHKARAPAQPAGLCPARRTEASVGPEGRTERSNSPQPAGLCPARRTEASVGPEGRTERSEY